MNLIENKLYLADIQSVINRNLPWEKLADKTIMVSGATGLIGSFLVDVIMMLNVSCKLIAISRNRERAYNRFIQWWNDPSFVYYSSDINSPLEIDDDIDVIIDLASNTHPVQYSTDPIGTIMTNVIGLNNMLYLASEKNVERFVFASSNEIYGENRGDVELFDESYCGYIDSNTMRAGYPESKRCGEALCQAYVSQKNLDIVVPRLTRSYGPTMLKSDSKAISQFIKNAISGENIVLKSEGKQFYSFTYITDAVSGLLTVLLSGAKGEAYNIAFKESDITLRELAQTIANEAGVRVVFDLPDEVERKGFSVATKARLDGSKLEGLGWKGEVSIAEGIRRTLEIIKALDC